jgi:hypothetical protein
MQCCSMGMHLATIETREEAKCIASFYSSKLVFTFVSLSFTPLTISDLNYTMMRTQNIFAISTIYFKNDYPHWCASDKPLSRSLSHLPWFNYEPDNGFPPENILAFIHVETDYGIVDCSSSFQSYYFICQSPD